jgi:hypothetical protein
MIVMMILGCYKAPKSIVLPDENPIKIIHKNKHSVREISDSIIVNEVVRELKNLKAPEVDIQFKSFDFICIIFEDGSKYRTTIKGKWVGSGFSNTRLSERNILDIINKKQEK